MRQLFGVDDRADAPDLTAAEVERPHGDHPLLSVEVQHTRAAVDLDLAHRHTRNPRGLAHPAEQGASDAVAPVQRPSEWQDLAAAVAGQLDVMGEQRLEPGKISLLGRRQGPRASSSRCSRVV